jgi:beta-barrel assembly-enhancing protease
MKLLVAFAISLGLAASASGAAKVKAKPAPPPPTYTGAYQPQGVDEAGLWKQSDESERELAESRLVIRDEQLNSFVRGVLCSTVGQDRCNSVRIYILRYPIFGASMYPNGMMIVQSGLLLRTQTEAELGAVLGHEFGHFEKRHTLQRFKATRKGTDLLSWAAVLTSMAGTQQAYRSFQSLDAAVWGNLANFSRENEREADMLGLGYLNTGTLRPQAASRVWRNLILEAEASAAARGLRKPDLDRITFFDTHPSDGERADYLYALASPDGDGRDEGADRYAKALAPWITAFVDDQVALNDFGASEFIINKIGENGWTADLWRSRGDLFRYRGNLRDLMNAADFYGKAVALNGELPEAQRGLGLSLIKTGRFTEGRIALEKYLQLKPAASDAAMISMTLASIGASK